MNNDNYMVYFLCQFHHFEASLIYKQGLLYSSPFVFLHGSKITSFGHVLCSLEQINLKLQEKSHDTKRNYKESGFNHTCVVLSGTVSACLSPPGTDGCGW